MQYFFRLVEGIQVMPLMAALARQPELWNTDDCRREFEHTPHAATSDVLLRFGSTDGNDLEAMDRAAMGRLPEIKKMLLDVMRLVNGSRLGRVVITRLEPGKKILPHADTMGEYAKYYTRFHLVLQGLPGSLFTCGDETVNMRTGELWYFDAAAEHAVMNNSADDRVHLLIDVRIDP